MQRYLMELTIRPQTGFQHFDDEALEALDLIEKIGPDVVEAEDPKQAAEILRKRATKLIVQPMYSAYFYKI